MNNSNYNYNYNSNSNSIYSNTNNNTDINRRLLDFYITQYNDTLDRIEYLYRSLETTNNRIDILYNNINNNRGSRNRNRRNRYNYNDHSRYHDYYSLPSNNDNTYYNTNTRYTDNPEINNRNNNYNNRYTNSPELNNRNTNTNTNDDLTSLFNTFLQNVPIIPSEEEILNSTRIVRYETIINPLNEACPISLDRFQPEDYVTQINYCGHIFKSEELNSWFNNNVRCPVCRYDIRSNNQTQNSRRTINSTVINNLADQLVSNIFNFENDHLLRDLSNNILIFEAIIQPNNSNTNSNSNTNQNDNL